MVVLHEGDTSDVESNVNLGLICSDITTVALRKQISTAGPQDLG